MTKIQVSVCKLPHGEDLPLPEYATPGSAGLDLMAAIDVELTIATGQRVLVPTGLSIALPENFEAQVRPRSGLAYKNGITVLNSPGTIDADYRGEIGVVLINHGHDDFIVTRGMRIAQLVVAPVTQLTWQEMNELPATERGAGGYGSTGVKGG